MDSDGPDARDPARPRRARALLVDQEPHVLRSLRNQIEGEAFEGLEASDLGTLREQLRHEPEVVLIDLERERSSGQELIGEVRSRSPESEIVVLTGYASVDSPACRHAGVSDYVEKHLADSGQVVRALRRALDRRSQRLDPHRLRFRFQEVIDDLLSLPECDLRSPHPRVDHLFIEQRRVVVRAR